MIYEQLKAPFPPEKISWRVGATNQEKTQGIALAYIDARDVMRRLDDVMGLDWQCRYSHVTDKGVICEIGLLINNEWRWRANGAGETDVEAEKGAMSDAFKRAAVLWGVGRYLYDLPNTWVPIKPYGRSYALVNPPPLPSWALPDGTEDAGKSLSVLGELATALNRQQKWEILRLSWEQSDAYRQAFGRLNTKQKTECRALEQEAAMLCAEYVKSLEFYQGEDDTSGAHQLVEELTNPTAKKLVWAGLSQETKHWIKSLKVAA